MKSMRKIIKIDDELCNGCGQCVPDCAEGSLAIIGGKARLVADKLCDGLGACLGSCPTGALQIIEREADDFDEKAVEAYLREKRAEATVAASQCGCPSAQFKIHPMPASASQPSASGAGLVSALSHWPVQIRLVSAKAPFLENCDLLVAADCTAVAGPNFHRDFLPGKVVMMGCPKFDDAPLYVERFREILATRPIKSLTLLIMEVPCCSAMLAIIKQARDLAQSTVPVRQVVFSTQGQVLHDQAW